ncbi:MAG: class I SAM-dependent methyltransferase [archaeon]
MIKNNESNWNAHWKNLNRSFLNKVFVFFRANVIANDVAKSLDENFPHDGVFLDSGSGTSQTSVKIPKRGRKFVAMDIADIIFHDQPKIVDYRVNGDVLRLPFRDNSLDGIWNVGLMEHFRQGELDVILNEFNRVLKRGGKAVLFWPPRYGPVALLIRFLSVFRMFPEEPSLIKSKRWVKGVVERNGFSLVDVKWPLRGALIHHTVVIKNS